MALAPQCQWFRWTLICLRHLGVPSSLFDLCRDLKSADHVFDPRALQPGSLSWAANTPLFGVFCGKKQKRFSGAQEVHTCGDKGDPVILRAPGLGNPALLVSPRIYLFAEQVLGMSF